MTIKKDCISLARENALRFAILDKDLTTPPGSPSEGDRYIIPTGATGDWAENISDIAYWYDDLIWDEENKEYIAGWRFVSPGWGTLVYVQDEDKFYEYLTSWELLW